MVKILDASFDGTVVKEQLMKQGQKKEEPAQIPQQQENKSDRSNGSNRSYERNDYDLDDPNHLTN